MLARENSSRIVLVLLSAAVLFSASPRLLVAGPATGDSGEVTGLLSDVKTEATQLKYDTEDMRSFARSQLSWQSHASKLTQIKEHVNAAGQLLTKLHEAKASASPWQQQAIDRVTPLLQELAANTSTMIAHLNKNQNRIHTPPYTEYVAANAETANDLSDLISDYVEYGNVKNRTEELEQKLEVPGN